MTHAEAQRRILRLVAEGKVTPEEALRLLDALNPEAYPDPQGAPRRISGEEPRPEMPEPPQGCARALVWTIGGVGGLFLALTVLWGLSGPALWVTLLCLTPLGLLGALLLALAWGMGRGVWLLLEVQQPPGERPSRIRLGLPLPLRWVPTVVGWLRWALPDDLPLDAEAVRALVETLDEEPVWLTVNDDDGTRVRLWLGRRVPQAA